MSKQSSVLPPDGTADWSWHWLIDGAGKPFVAQLRSEIGLDKPSLARWFFSSDDAGLWALDLCRRGWSYLGPVEHPGGSSKPAPVTWRRPDWRDLDRWRLVVSELSEPVMALNHKGDWYLGDGHTCRFSKKIIAELVQEFILPRELLPTLNGKAVVHRESSLDLITA